MTTIDAPKFMDALLLFKTSDGQKFQRQDGDEDGAVMDWALFGRCSAHLYRTAPSTSFMYGD